MFTLRMISITLILLLVGTVENQGTDAKPVEAPLSSTSPSEEPKPSQDTYYNPQQDTPVDDVNPEPPDYSKDYTTIYLVEFITEGAKIPVNPFFKLPHSDKYGKDQLTPNGEAQLYNLGVALNNQYPKLFDPDTDSSQNPTKFYSAYSDSSPVSQASAISHLMGVYTPSEKFSPKITSEFFSATKKPEYKTAKRTEDTFYPFYDNTYGFDRKKNYTKKETQDFKKSPPEPLPHYLTPHHIITQPDDQDFFFHTDIEATCPKIFPKIEKSWRLYLTDIKKHILKIEKFLDSKFLAKGYKELRGFKWTPQEIMRVYEALLSYFGEFGKTYKGVRGGYGHNWGIFKQNPGDDDDDGDEDGPSSSSSGSNGSPKSKPNNTANDKNSKLKIILII